jgi:Major Facilitator Superfamily
MNDSSSVSNTAAGTIVCCVLVALCEGFDLQAAGVAAAGITPEFGPTPEQLGRFFSASTLGLFLGALAGGRLADTLGRRSILVASFALFGAFSLLTAQASGIASLTSARLLTGFGLGGAFPTLVAWVNEHSAPTRRRANVALVYGGMPFGGALAVAAAFGVGGALLAAQGYFYASAASIYPTSIRGVGSGATVAVGRLGSVAGPLLGGALTAAGHRSTPLLSEIVPLVALGSIAALAFAWRNSRTLPG